MASAETESELVLVTGASGFLATHVVQALLGAGYRVRGTVRALDNDTKVKPLREMAEACGQSLDLVEADLTKPDTWPSAVKGCTYVIHVASPFPASAGATEDEVVKPAVEGTTAVLKASQEAKVKRVVLTSSVVAVTGGMAPGMDGSRSFTEEDWGDPEKASDVYAKSKVLAEKTAWDFIKQLSEEEKEGAEDRLELATILPGFIMGPVLCGGSSTSMEVPRRLLERSMPAVPKLFFPVADVRDVAQAHVKALTIPECAGQRHIVYTSGHWLKEVAQIIAKEFKPQGYCVPTLHCPYFVVWVKALFDKTIKMTLPSIGKSVKLNNAKMSEVLGLEPHPLSETVLDMCYSMIEKGFIKKSKKYRGPKKEGQEEEGQGEEEEEEGEEGKEKEEGKEDKEGDSDEKKKKNEVEKEANGDVAKEKTEDAKENGEAEPVVEAEEAKADGSPASTAEEATEEGTEQKEGSEEAVKKAEDSQPAADGEGKEESQQAE